MTTSGKPPGPSWRDKLVDLADRRFRRSVLGMAGDWGWDVHPGAPQWIPRTPLHVYLLDPETEQTVMAVVNWEDLDEIAAWSGTWSCDEVRSAIIGLLADRASVDVDLGAGRSRRREMATVLAVRYLTDTETFRRIPRATTGAHCIILVYRPKGSANPEGILRPFALVARDRPEPLRPEELREFSKRVVEQDRLTHPDWFRSASVTPLRSPR